MQSPSSPNNPPPAEVAFLSFFLPWWGCFFLLYFTFASVSPPLPAAPRTGGLAARCGAAARGRGPLLPDLLNNPIAAQRLAELNLQPALFQKQRGLARWGAAASRQPPVPPPQALSAACKVGRVPLGIFRGTTRAPDGS